MHESNVRFEHCYRLDMDPKIAATHRYKCWSSWSERYAYGQSRDRREYARRRIIALESGDIERINVHHMPNRRERIFSETGPAAEPAGSPAAPAPTSAHAPPPALAPVQPPPTATTPTTAKDLPGTTCTRACEKTYRTCQAACGDDVDACTKCREDYRSCMRRCYE
jgi:hypothetical protein